MPSTTINNSVINQQGEQNWLRLPAQYQHALAAHKSEICHAFGLSAFIAEHCISHPERLQHIIDHNWHNHIDIAQVCQTLAPELENIEKEADFHRALRAFRQLHMIGVAWRDLMQRQSIQASLEQVSQLADCQIMSAYHWLYQQHTQLYGVPVGSHGPQPMLIIGMGKLGGRELNFSSDIDLIFCYPEKGEIAGKRRSLEHQQFFTKLAQKLIAALNKVTADGQVFRVDMRLRPFGESGPLVMHFAALEDYYQEQGRQWERFAMLKGRILNEETPYTEQLSQILHPFTFRRYLDFTTLDAIREMKQLIAKETRRRRLTNNIKLGAGGIREVEFFAQSFQLIHGGREAKLQSKSLVATLHTLPELDLVDEDVTSSLLDDYFYLRKLEHTLQEFNDEQTQTLPDTPWAQSVCASVMGFTDFTALLTHTESVMQRINQHFNSIIEQPNDVDHDDDNLFQRCEDAWLLALPKDDIIALIQPPLSDQQAEEVYHTLFNFRQQLRQYRIGQRGEDSLNKLMPEIIYLVLTKHAHQPVAVLKRILTVINAITGRTTYLDLLLENPDVNAQLFRLCEKSDWITQQIRQFPLLLDELLSPVYLQAQQTDIAQAYLDYRSELQQLTLRIEPDDVETLMDQWRQFRLCQQLRIAAADISGSLPVAKVSDKLTALAEVVLDNVIRAAWYQITEKYGAPGHLKDGEQGFAAIAYGKMGGFELGYGSDLDLVFIHNAPQQSDTNGPKVVSAQQFYIKLTQRIMHLLNTNTLLGQLYETDLRLRPAGNAGLLCCHISGFSHYQENEAWTWEHQALVRARVVYGDAELKQAFTDIRQATLCRQRPLAQLAQDVSDMRAKMRHHLLKNTQDGVDLKQCEGGITDIEFIAQYWVLAHAHNAVTLTEWSDNLRIIESVKTAGIIDDVDAIALQQAYLTLRDSYHHLTLSGESLAAETDQINQSRITVTKIWDRLFGHIDKRE